MKDSLDASMGTDKKASLFLGHEEIKPQRLFVLISNSEMSDVQFDSNFDSFSRVTSGSFNDDNL